MYEIKRLIKDGMIIEIDVPFTLSDGVVLRCDIFRSEDEGKKYPTIFSFGPYCKGLSLLKTRTYRSMWDSFCREDPTTPYQSSNKYQNWEVVDPEIWTVKYGYACVRFDSRGAGSSEGFFDVMNHRQEAEDMNECMDWVASLPWSDGNIGMAGISYYAGNQWAAASLKPSKHLKAICPFEGYSDLYREVNRTGGIYSKFMENWFEMQIVPIQHGMGVRGAKHLITGDPACGYETLPRKELENNRVDPRESILHQKFITDEYFAERQLPLEKIKIPVLSAANWSGHGVHPRGNYKGFEKAGTDEKWLEIHPWTHGTMFVNKYGNEMMKQFFDHYVKDEDNGWEKQPKVFIWRRFADRFGEFDLSLEKDWPLPQTEWENLYCTTDGRLTFEKPEKTGQLTFDAMGQGLTFITDPLPEDVEICGPMASKMRISSSTQDSDIFVIVRIFTADMHEVVNPGQDLHHPFANGWLRASQRKLDEKESKFYQPVHSHDEEQLLAPGEPVDLDVEIWPSGMVIPKGYRIGYTIRGKDYEWSLEALTTERVVFAEPMNGCGPVIHTNPQDRKPEIFGGKTTLYFDKDNSPSLLIPFIPREKYYPDQYYPTDKYYSHKK